MKNSAALDALHWDVISLLERDGGWVSSRTLYEWLRPKYGHTQAATKTMQRALQRLYAADIVESRGEGSARSWRGIPDNKPVRAEVKSVELAVALLQLEQFAAKQLPASALKTLHDYCERSRALLDSHPTYPRFRQGRAWRGKAAIVDSGFPLLPPPLNEAVLRAVTEALYCEKMLSLRYQNGELSGEPSRDYRVSPLALIERGSVLYLVSSHRLRRSGKYVRYLHRLDRIIEAAETPDPADLDPAFDLDRFLHEEHSLLFFPEAPQRVVLSVRENGFRSRLRDYRLSEDQVIKDVPGGFELSATVRPSLTFKQFLLGQAPDVVLRKPESLRRELQAVLAATTAAYAEGMLNHDEAP